MSIHTPLRIPDHLSRADIGAYMRDLRLHYSLTEQDVSERLHIRIKYVSAIERAEFDAMPGKAYARGYVHTYAEFLGLDAEQVVERCFGAELAREVQAHSLPQSSEWGSPTRKHWGIAAIVLFAIIGGFFALHKKDDGVGDTAEVVTTVESVPEDYLAGLRTMLMPVADNVACLDHATPLGCYYAQQLTRLWVTRKPPEHEMLPIDEEAEKKAKEEAAAKKEAEEKAKQEAEEKEAAEKEKAEKEKAAAMKEAEKKEAEKKAAAEKKKADEKKAAVNAEEKPTAKKEDAADTATPAEKPESSKADE